jgi:nucleotide-binding universal stress UspA family protein
LVLLYVRPSLLNPKAFTGLLHELSESEANHKLQQLAGTLPAGVAVEYEVGSGDIETQIVRAARHHHADLMVLGQRDPRSTPDELVQTTALDLLPDAPCPLLMVPPGSHSHTAPKRVLLAADDQPVHLGASAAIAAALLAGTELTVTYVAAEHADAQAALHWVQQAGLASAAASVAARCVQHTHTAAGIVHAAQSLQADLLVVLARRRSLLGGLFHRSVTAEVLREAPVPVLVVPERA